MKNQDLFKASLDENSKENLQSYDIKKFLYLALLGGVLPLIALGTKNAKSLKVDKKLTNLLLALGILVLIGRLMVAFMFSTEFIALDNRSIRSLYRMSAVILYLGYAYAMKRQYQIFLSYGGKTKPMLKDAIKWLILEGLLEGAALLPGLI